ncbi:hypothetical protein Hanom_Chr03g00224961 [Helianthus anomalus]
MGSDLTGTWSNLVGMLTVFKASVFSLSRAQQLFSCLGSLTRRNQVASPMVAVVSHQSITILSPRISFHL